MSDPDGSPAKTLKKKRRSVRFSMHASMYSFDTESPVGIEEANGPKKDCTPPKSLLKRRNTFNDLGDLAQDCEQTNESSKAAQPMTSEEKQRRINLILEQKKKTDLPGMLKASNEGRLMEYLADDLRALGLEPDKKDAPGLKNGSAESAEPHISADPDFRKPLHQEIQKLENLPVATLLQFLVEKGISKEFLDANVEQEPAELVAFANAKMLNLLPLLGAGPNGITPGNAVEDGLDTDNSNSSFGEAVPLSLPLTQSSLDMLSTGHTPQQVSTTPSVAASSGDQDMSPWVAVEDPDDKGWYYYWHTVTGETMWTTPEGVEAAIKAGPLRFANAVNVVASEASTPVQVSTPTQASSPVQIQFQDDNDDAPPVGVGHRRKMTLEQTYAKAEVVVSSATPSIAAATADGGDLKNMSAAQLRVLFTNITGKPATSWDKEKMRAMIQEAAPNSYSAEKAGHSATQEVPTAYRRNYAAPPLQVKPQHMKPQQRSNGAVIQPSSSFCVANTRAPQPRQTSPSVSKWEVEKSLAKSASVLKSFETVLSWMQGVLVSSGENVNVTGDFGGGSILQSGIVLCKLLNIVAPGTVAKIHDVASPVNGFFMAASKFKAQENATNFIRGCQKLGLPKNCTFDAQELTELRDIRAVLRCVENLAKLVKDIPGYNGLTM